MSRPWQRLRAALSLGDEAGPTELARIQPYALGSRQVLAKLHHISRDIVARGVPGDCVECGVCNGGSAAAIALAMTGSDRRVWLYDSFAGLPAPGARDIGAPAGLAGACRGSEEAALEAMRLVGFPTERCVIRKGWFEDTFSAELPEAVSFLHIDADWYESVKLALATFHDRVSPGGVILLDDFGHWEGCREAFYDFVAERGLKPLLERFGHTQAFWVKGRAHNRDSLGRWEIP